MNEALKHSLRRLECMERAGLRQEGRRAIAAAAGVKAAIVSSFKQDSDAMEEFIEVMNRTEDQET